MDFPFVFARFCHFFRYRADEALSMPARLFFTMDRQIGRIRAEVDRRVLATNATIMGGDYAQEVNEGLLAELGEVYQIERSALVMREDGAIELLKSLV